jgi:hypothetical protein
VTRPLLAPAFCQVAWVVRDMAIAEKFFVETMGISRRVMGVVTEIVGATEAGHELRRNLKAGKF